MICFFTSSVLEVPKVELAENRNQSLFRSRTKKASASSLMESLSEKAVWIVPTLGKDRGGESSFALELLYTVRAKSRECSYTVFNRISVFVIQRERASLFMFWICRAS